MRDPPRTALFSRFNTHDSLGDMAIGKTDLASCKIYSTHLQLKRKHGVGNCVAQPAVVTLCPNWACGLIGPNRHLDGLDSTMF